MFLLFFFQAEDGIRDYKVTGVQTCALPISQPVPANPRARAVRLPPDRDRLRTAGAGGRADRVARAVGGDGCDAVGPGRYGRPRAAGAEPRRARRARGARDLGPALRRRDRAREADPRAGGARRRPERRGGPAPRRERPRPRPRPPRPAVTVPPPAGRRRGGLFQPGAPRAPGGAPGAAVPLSP